MDRVDDCALDPWICTALNNHFYDHDNKTSGQIQEVTPHGYCHVWNVMSFDKPISGMMGVCDIDDSQLSIKALFTEDAVKTFEENEAQTSCLGFCDINNNIMVLKKYHIMMDVTPQIEQCQLAICVDEFLIRSINVTPPCRDSLVEAVTYPAIVGHIRQIWRAKYSSEEQDSSSTNACSEETLQEQDALSQLLELLTDASQNMTSCSETDQRTDEQRRHCGFYDLDKAEYKQWRTLGSSEVLKKVIEDVTKMVIRSIEDAEGVKSKIPETVKRGQGSRVHPIPAAELVNLSMDLIDPAECDIPDGIVQKLDSMEEWKVDYFPPCSDRAVASSSIDITSFNTQPSVEHRKKDEAEQAQESVASQRCKRKVVFSPRSQSPCKMAKSSEGYGSKISQDQEASNCLNSNQLLERIQRQSGTQPEMAKQSEEEKHSENSEAVEGLTQLCDCLTPCEEDEDESDGAGFQRKHCTAYDKEYKRQSQKTGLREEEQVNRIGMTESDHQHLGKEEWMISCDGQRQNIEEDSFSDESCTSESLLLSCEIEEPLSTQKQNMNKEQLEELNDTDTNSDFSAESEDCTQLEMVSSVSSQQPKSCPKGQIEVKSAQDSKGSQQHVNSQALPSSKLVHTSARSFKKSQHAASRKTSDMFIDVHTQTSGTPRKTSGVLNVARIPKVDKTTLRSTSSSSISSTSSDRHVTSSNARPVDKLSRPFRPAESSSLIASMCSLKMCGSDWVVKSLPSLTHSQSRLKETSSITKSSKRRSTDGTTDGDDLPCKLKNYKLERHILEWCATIACSNVKTTRGKRAPKLTGQ